MDSVVCVLYYPVVSMLAIRVATNTKILMSQVKIILVSRCCSTSRWLIMGTATCLFHFNFSLTDRNVALREACPTLSTLCNRENVRGLHFPHFTWENGDPGFPHFTGFPKSYDNRGYSLNWSSLDGGVVLLCIAEILQCRFRDVPAIELINIALKSTAWI